MVKRNKCYRPQLVIPQTFEQCFTYEKQVLFLKNEIDKLKTQVDTSKIEQRLAVVEANLAMLSSEVAEINVDEIKAQLQSINAELTELKNTSSAQADSITALQTTVAGKQNTLTFDSTPTAGSNNPVTSDGIRKALASKQNTLTFDSTPTAGSNNPVTSDGIRTAIDEAGGSSRVEWVETNFDAFLASLPDNVTYTRDIKLDDINNGTASLVSTDMLKGTFTRTGMFISSDKIYLKVVFNVTDVTITNKGYINNSHASFIDQPYCSFIYCAYYVTIKQEGSNFIYTNNLYGTARNYSSVYSTTKMGKGGNLNADGVVTCNVYFKLLPDLPIDLI